MPSARCSGTRRALWIIHALHIPLAKVEHYAPDFSAHAYMIVVQGMTPIPYKLVTIASGLAGVPFLAFHVVFRHHPQHRALSCWKALLVHFFGAQAKALLDKYLGIALIGFLVVVLDCWDSDRARLAHDARTCHVHRTLRATSLGQDLRASPAPAR